MSVISNPEPPTPAGHPPGPSPELLAEIQEASQRLETATPQEILQWAVSRFAPRFTMATAFGPEGMTIIHMLAEIAPETPIFNLDTGYQFPETLALRDRIFERYGMRVELKRPQLTVLEYEQLNGGPSTRPIPIDAARNARFLSSKMQRSVWMHGPARFVAIKAPIARSLRSLVGTRSLAW